MSKHTTVLVGVARSLSPPVSLSIHYPSVSSSLTQAATQEAVMASILAHLPPSTPVHRPNKSSVTSFKPSISSLPAEVLLDLRLINSVAFATEGNRRSRSMRSFLVRSSDDDSFLSGSETAIAAATEEEAAAEELEDSPVEVPKGPPSLISSLNVEKALRGIAITDVDHYAILGISSGCPYDQIPIAYKNKVDELKNQELEEVELSKQLEQLKESYTILSSVEDRRLYDWSLARSDQPGRYTWPFEADITQTPTGIPPPREPEDVGPTRVVGYFLLGWLILGFILSIVLNQ